MSVENQAGSDAAPSESVVQTEAPITEGPQEGVNDAAQEKQKTGNPKIDDPWPESARNKVNRLNKQLAERSAREKDLARKLAQYEAAQEKAAKETSAPKEPNENDFDNYGDYLKAVAKYRPQEQPKQDAVDPKKIEEQAIQQARVQMHREQRMAEVAKQAEAIIKDHPEVAQLGDEYADVLDAMPGHVDMMFLNLDNAPAAFYALAKDGNFETVVQQLAQTDPVQAANFLIKAQTRGEQMMKASKVSKAPPPISGVKGNSSGIKGMPDGKSVDDVMKWVRS